MNLKKLTTTSLTLIIISILFGLQMLPTIFNYLNAWLAITIATFIIVYISLIITYLLYYYLKQ